LDKRKYSDDPLKSGLIHIVVLVNHSKEYTYFQPLKRMDLFMELHEVSAVCVCETGAGCGKLHCGALLSDQV